MNERIKELAEQCTTIYSSTTFPVDKDFDYEKFAELIVKECADVINDGVLNSDGSGDWYTGYVAGATECRRKINQHFGVES
jgi:hypothetical protein